MSGEESLLATMSTSGERQASLLKSVDAEEFSCIPRRRRSEGGYHRPFRRFGSRSFRSFLAASLTSPAGFHCSGKAASIISPTYSGNGLDVNGRKKWLRSRAQLFICNF